MENKEQLINHIREWVKIDEEIKTLNAELRTRREKKKKLTSDLVDVMKNNEIDCFDINNGKLIYSKNRVKAPLNKKTLTQALQKYYDNTDEAERMTEYLMESRNETIKENIRRKVQN